VKLNSGTLAEHEEPVHLPGIALYSPTVVVRKNNIKQDKLILTAPPSSLIRFLYLSGFGKVRKQSAIVKHTGSGLHLAQSDRRDIEFLVESFGASCTIAWPLHQRLVRPKNGLGEGQTRL
jgi:hypothetical protein